MKYNIEDGILLSVQGEDEAIAIPNGVTEIADKAFFEKKIKRAILPEGLKVIGKFAFAKCSELEQIYIPDSVCAIGGSAFKDCVRLKKLKLPKSLDRVRSRLCYGDTSLQEIVIPEKAIRIGREAFMDCTALEQVEIGDHVQEIMESAFENCASLCRVRLPKDLISIEAFAFANCELLEEIALPNGVERIERMAFASCGHKVPNSANFKLDIPDSIQYLSQEAIVGCDWSLLFSPELLDRLDKTMADEEVGVTPTGDGGYIAVTGRSELWKYDAEGNRSIIRIMMPGASFGDPPDGSEERYEF